jgi:hypothetical protein
MDFLQKGFIVFLNSPCYETPKNAIKIKSTKQMSECFFLGAAANVRHFHYLFFTPPPPWPPFYFYFICFIAFLGVSWQVEFKQQQKTKTNPSVLITKNVAFSPFCFPLTRVFCSIFVSRFLAFRNKGCSKTRYKNSQIFFCSSQKK